MKIFVIHRTESRDTAEEFLRDIGLRLGGNLDAIFMDSSSGSSWKAQAREEIYESAAILVFDPEACKHSENAIWEIEISEQLEKRLVYYSPEDPIESSMSEFRQIYEYECEFERYFSKAKDDPAGALEIFKVMVETSEELVRRRQITNGFFITLIGGLVAASGFVLEKNIFQGNERFFLIVPVVAGLLLCRSWANLIENYGKLNGAKFKVINRLERELASQVFSAEWAALGKGLDPRKYQSFTVTERIVPILFMFLLIVLLVPILWGLDWTKALALLSKLGDFLTALRDPQT